ncbi:MAG TPA: hypothetical protein ENI09_00025 [candidate division WWE3 bacterium]|uniref:3D domain-containing protein n=1 Tax=candidate division WWE3 bacterium TaxID=2053526 RepID=A0A7C1NM34_UNCKA|nr:hypothetical protein [candidate division WWE3 bacterium]
MSKRNAKESTELVNSISRSVVQSILLIGLATVIAAFAAPKLKTDIEPKVLSAQAECDGVKLNYPRVIKEKLPNGKTSKFRYNCIRSGFIASSYDGNCEGCSGRTHFTNEPVVWGICAVDQNTIAPHSYFYVPGYGTCKAADKGGAVKGKKIDLGFESVSQGWWSRRVTDIFTFVE